MQPASPVRSGPGRAARAPSPPDAPAQDKPAPDHPAPDHPAPDHPAQDLPAQGPQTRSQATPDTSRWFGVGHSQADDPYLRGREATLAATSGSTADPSLVIALIDSGTELAEVLEGIRRAVPGNPQIVGCTTDGELTAAGPICAGVAVAALGGPGFEVRITVAEQISADQRAAGRAVAAGLDGLNSPHTALILISDGLASQHDMVRGVYGVTGAAVPLVGGCAADNVAFARTFQFAGDAGGVRILSDSVVGVALSSPAPIGIGISHGWHKSGNPMTITSSRGGEIFEFDGEPALDAYLRSCPEPAPDLDDRGAFRLWAHRHPLGLSRRSGEDLRVVNDVDRETGTLLCLADVPQGALAWTMHTDTDSLIECATESCRQALAEYPLTPPLGMLIFDCGARKARLGQEGIEAEVAGIARTVGQVPFTGFYTYGEIARVHGARGMHHMTVVSLALW
jgi:hypothetical protein